MKWANSLIRLSTHEVETVQKRLAEIVARRWAVEMQIEALDTELAAERANKAAYEEVGFYLAGFSEGARIRREALVIKLGAIRIEEEGAREAMAEAFENLKKYEHVAEAARLAARKEAGRRETAELDELGLRKRVAR